MVKIRVGIDKLTELRSKIRQAYDRDDAVAAQWAADELIDYLRLRRDNDELTEDEQHYLDEHPKLVAYLDHVEDVSEWWDAWDGPPFW